MFIKLLYISFFFVIQGYYGLNELYPKFRMKILHTPILSFLSVLKLHHIVILETNHNVINKNNVKDTYLIDFSPINQKHIKTLLSLLFARNVLGEIRIRHIINNEKTDNMMIEEWDQINNMYENESQILSDKIYSNIKHDPLKNIINEIKLWNIQMNLYKHNCQHFSSHVKKIIKKYSDYVIT